MARPSGGVQSVDRSLLLLELLADAGGSLRLAELEAATGLPLPTVHRLIRALVDNGYVRQEPSRRYALGPRLIRLGETAARGLGSWAMPQLRALVAEIGETANLALLDGHQVVYVAQVPSGHSMRMFTEVGRRVGAHCTGVGKALLARLGPEEVLDLRSRSGMEARTPQTITDPARMLEELEAIRERGWALDDGEQEAGVCCVAVAVDPAPTLLAVSVSGPRGRSDPARVEAVAPRLQAAARDLGRVLAETEGPAPVAR